MLAMLCQLASDEMLVPPNLRTIQAEVVRVTESFLGRTGKGGRSCRLGVSWGEGQRARI
jgi:hypothetical protein